MKVTVTLVGPFEADPATAEARTMTIGELQASDLPRSVATWVHDVVARMCHLPADAVPGQAAIWEEGAACLD